MSCGQRYDFVIFGATGYTGKFVFEELLKQLNEEKFSIAIAGRSREKLSRLISEVNTSDDIPIIIADVNDYESLLNMAKQSKVLLNCVGPYRFYGEQVVKACIENGTHHLDISGEPQYLESMELRYHKEAESKGCYIIGACGFDSIPAEMGVKFVANTMDNCVNDVECYIQNKCDKNMKIHFTTWESAVYGLSHRAELSSLRRQLFKQKLPRPKYSQPKRFPLFHSKDVSRWCLPFPGADKPVVIRSQNFLHFERGLRPIHFTPYITMESVFLMFLTILFGGLFTLLTSFKCGRYLLLNFPKLFSCGFVSHEGASRKSLENSKMELIFVGKGWRSKESIDTVKPDRKVICSVTGPEPGYLSCSIFIVQAGITVLKESDKMPGKGGVYAPLAAFYDTKYIDRLQNSGIHFNKLSDGVID